MGASSWSEDIALGPAKSAVGEPTKTDSGDKE